MESEHAKMLKEEFARMEQRVKTEFARQDIRINGIESVLRKMQRDMEN